MTHLGLHDLGVTLLETPVLRDVVLDVPAGSWTSLIGPNGAGKTTLLRAVAGAVAYDGHVTFDGATARTTSHRERARTLAVVPQQPERPQGMRIIDYVLLGRSAYVPYLGTERAADLHIAEAQLRRLDLLELAERAVDAVSGGEFQRAVLARALAQQAPVLLLDEPTSSLDLGHAQQVLELVDDLRIERQLTVLSALHDLNLAGQFSDELVLLVDGRIVARGTAQEVLTTEAIARHYGANVSVVRDEHGHTALVPVRPRRAPRERSA